MKGLRSDVDEDVSLSSTDFVNGHDSHLVVVAVQPAICAEITRKQSKKKKIPHRPTLCLKKRDPDIIDFNFGKD